MFTQVIVIVCNPHRESFYSSFHWLPWLQDQEIISGWGKYDIDAVYRSAQLAVQKKSKEWKDFSGALTQVVLVHRTYDGKRNCGSMHGGK